MQMPIQILVAPTDYSASGHLTSAFIARGYSIEEVQNKILTGLPKQEEGEMKFRGPGPGNRNTIVAAAWKTVAYLYLLETIPNVRDTIQELDQLLKAQAPLRKEALECLRRLREAKEGGKAYTNLNPSGDFLQARVEVMSFCGDHEEDKIGGMNFLLLQQHI